MLHAVCIESGCVGTGRSGVVAKVGGTESIRNLSFDVAYQALNHHVPHASGEISRGWVARDAQSSRTAHAPRTALGHSHWDWHCPLGTPIPMRPREHTLTARAKVPK